MSQVRPVEQLQFDNEIYLKLKEAEAEAKATDKRFSYEEVFDGLREFIKGIEMKGKLKE